MAKIVVSKEARKDLVRIRDYVRDELANPEAADRLIRKLRLSVEKLVAFPRAGKPLDALLPVQSEYRYLVCENYCVFYLEEGENVVAVRILHQRQDCMRIFFE